MKKDLELAGVLLIEKITNQYYNSIDRINELKEISFEGSEDYKMLNIMNKELILNFQMESNSLLVVTLTKTG